MLLRDCRFLVSSYELRFCAFSDQPCRAVHLKSVQFDTPGSAERADWYEIQPAPGARWVAVEETIDFDKSRVRFFVHEGPEFVERKRSEIALSMLVDICRRLPLRHITQTRCKVKPKPYVAT